MKLFTILAILFFCSSSVFAGPAANLNCEELKLVNDLIDIEYPGASFEVLGIGYDGFAVKLKTPTQELVAKLAKPSKDWGAESLKNEIKFGDILRAKNASKHFVRPKRGPGNSVLVDYVPGAISMDKWLGIQNHALNKDVANSLLSQLESIRKELQELEIVHSDIRPANIVVTPDLQLIVIDFGIAASPGGYAPHLGTARGNIGEFQSPGARDKQPASFADDAYSIQAVSKIIRVITQQPFRHSGSSTNDPINIRGASASPGSQIKFRIKGGPQQRGLLSDVINGQVWIYSEGTFQHYSAEQFELL